MATMVSLKEDSKVLLKASISLSSKVDTTSWVATSFDWKDMKKAFRLLFLVETRGLGRNWAILYFLLIRLMNCNCS